MSNRTGRRSAKRDGSSERGIALVLVMMTIDLFAVLVGSLALAALTETAVAANYRDAADALYAAEAAVEFVLQEIALVEDWTEVLAAPGQSSFVDGEPAGVRQAGAEHIDLSQETIEVSAAATPPEGAVALPAVLHAFGRFSDLVPRFPPARARTWRSGWPTGPLRRKTRTRRRRRIGGGGGVWRARAFAGQSRRSSNGPTPRPFACSRGANCRRFNAIARAAAAR